MDRYPMSRRVWWFVWVILPVMFVLIGALVLVIVIPRETLARDVLILATVTALTTLATFRLDMAIWRRK